MGVLVRISLQTSLSVSECNNNFLPYKNRFDCILGGLSYRSVQKQPRKMEGLAVTVVQLKMD